MRNFKAFSLPLLLALTTAMGMKATSCKELNINRYHRTSLTQARADQITIDMTNILRTVDGPGDVFCDIAFVRGSMTTFTTGDGSIDTQAELNAVFNLPGRVKVVNRINFCEGRIDPSFIGCGQTPGNSFIMERSTSSSCPEREGILWVHEYGHNKGLPHRNQSYAVMHQTFNCNHRRINSTESQAYLR